MRLSVATLRETISASFLVALLSGVLAGPVIMAVACLVLLAHFLPHFRFSTALVEAAAVVKGVVAVGISAIGGGIGSVVLWRMTLPFGLIAALAQQLLGPSRRVSVAVGALYGAAWGAVIDHIDPMGLPRHPMEQPSSVFELKADAVDGHLALMALYGAIGAAVGLLMPWRSLLCSWATGRPRRWPVISGPLFLPPVRPFRWIRRRRNADPPAQNGD